MKAPEVAREALALTKAQVNATTTPLYRVSISIAKILPITVISGNNNQGDGTGQFVCRSPVMFSCGVHLSHARLALGGVSVSQLAEI